MVKKLDNYLFELQTPNVNVLPPKVINSLLNDVYPQYFGKSRKGFFKKEVQRKYSLSDINRINKSAYNDLFMPSELKWSKGNLKTANKLKLIGVLNFGNGDYAFYSLKNGNIYIWTHDFGDFSHKVDGKERKKLWQPMSYGSWVKKLKSGKMIDAFIR